VTILEIPERRIEGPAKVTGAARYAADMSVPGMLHAAFVGSPYPHARIVSVDTAAARAMPGVRAVITGADVKGARFGRNLQDRPVLCWDTVRFVGDRVAAVAADTLAIAERAAAAIVVEYEELAAILDMDAATAPDAPVLHPDADAYHVMRGQRAARPHPNVQGHARHEHGDVDAAFAAATHVFSHTFRTARVHQGYIEPRAAIVWIDGETVRVITTNKAPFSFREQLSRTIGVPPERIVVDAGHIGGDFGGKGLSVDDHALYYLARAAGRPVRSVMRYADDVQVTNTRHAARIALRTALSDDGRIVAHESRVLFDGGAYAAGKPAAMLQPGDALFTLAGYDVPNARIDSTTVYTNTVPAGHDRAPGLPQNSFSAESHMDMIAREMGIDPLELRARNAIRSGGVDVEGGHWSSSRVPEVIATLRREGRWSQALPAGRGRGCAIGVRHTGRGKTSLKIRMDADGSVEILTAVSDQGGGQQTLFQRILAQELGVPLERIRVRRGTTAETLVDPGVGGSRVTPVQGNAVLDGARQLKELLAAGRTPPLEVEGRANSDAHVYGAYGYVVEVEVDRETGQLRVLDVLLVADVGTVINPVALRGQLAGGFVFGLGQTLMEELLLEDGRITTANLGDYKIPTIADVPPLRIVLITDDPGPGPFGSKSVGELANPAIGPAVANAVADAVGTRVTSLPVTAEKIFGALRTTAR